jgi:hypothetical protein
MLSVALLMISFVFTDLPCKAPPVPHGVWAGRLVACCREKQREIVVNMNVVYELWSNPQTGTWTILRTQLNGLSCIAGSGYGFYKYRGKLV